MWPPDGQTRLGDLAVDLVAKASSLAGRAHGAVQEGIAELVRSMNCYYSNLIEGHNTHPRDIDAAVAENYSPDSGTRILQLEARAHIEVQKMIDGGEGPEEGPPTTAYLQWIHREFCRRLPDELLRVENPDTGARIRVVPGELRGGGVIVGRHVPPPPGDLPRFLDRFQSAYAPERLSKMQSILAVAAAHHRFLWIHPFYDGNGRVARLLSHAMLLRAGVGSGLWSVARGLARNVAEYKARLANADLPRQGDYDGRGQRSAAQLGKFCGFFLRTCIDQVEFMGSLLEPGELLRRIRLYTDDEVAAGRMPARSFPLLREALQAGEFARGRAAEITGYRERRSRQILAGLLDRGLLVSSGPRAPVRLGFPPDVVERWFPRLYPEAGYQHRPPGPAQG